MQPWQTPIKRRKGKSMKMKRAVWALLLILACTSAAMAAPKKHFYSSGDAGSLITLDQSTVAVIELWSTPSTGYGWHVKSPLSKHIRILGSKFEAPQPGMLGGGGNRSIYVVGTARGRSELVLEYRRAHSEDAVDMVSYIVETTAAFTEKFSVPSPDAEQQPVGEAQTEVSADLGLPTAFNWCDQNGCTPVKDQGNCGSCWAFATVGPLESLIKINDGKTVDLSEQYLVSCNDEGWGCDGGFWAHDYHMVNGTKNSSQNEAGAVLESVYPYQGMDLSCGQNYNKSYQISSWEYVCGNSYCTPSTAELKQAIYEHGPLTVAVCANIAMQNYRSGVFTQGCNQVNHGVVLVGWNDNDSCWIMRNSWGRNWGESGYMRIGYGVSRIGAQATYVAYKDSPNPDPDPGPDPEPDQCVTANNSDHIAQGRAYRCGLFNWRACAVGSGDNLGGTKWSSSLQESAPDYWERVWFCRP
jgi:inhibitor of cysteine peptidase